MALADNKAKIQALIAGINALPEAGSGEAPEPVLQEKTVTPTKSAQHITPDAGYDGLSKVAVNPIPGEYIVPSGTVNITENGTHDVKTAEKVSVSVPAPEIKTQEKTVTPTTSTQTVTPDTSYDGLSKVTVNAMPTATQATPAISVSSSGLITASATQMAGYVAAGTKSGTKQLAVQAAKTITPSKSAQTAVESGQYTTGAVTVAAIPSQYEDVTSPLADLNAANGGTAASTMSGAVDNTEALASAQAALIAQIASALEGKAAGGGGNEMNTGSCTVVVTPAANSNHYTYREIVNSDGTIEYKLGRSYTSSNIPIAARCDSVMVVMVTYIKSATVTGGEILAMVSGYGVVLKTPATNGATMQVTLGD